MTLYFAHQPSREVLGPVTLPMQYAHSVDHAGRILRQRSRALPVPLFLAVPLRLRKPRRITLPQADRSGILLVWHRHEDDLVPGIGSRPDERWYLAPADGQVIREKWLHDDSELGTYDPAFEDRFMALVNSRRRIIRMCSRCLLPVDQEDVCECCRPAEHRIPRIVGR